MNQGPPYREPCDGWDRTSYSGGCFQHWRRSESRVTKFHNETVVADYLCQDEGGREWPYRPPYPRQSSSDSDGSNPDCFHADPPALHPGDPEWCAPGHPLHTAPPCNAWTREEFVACAVDLNTIASIQNCLRELLDRKANLALCQKVGFKAVAAKKTWHGCYGMDDEDNPACGGAATPSQTKYLRVRREVTLLLKVYASGTSPDPPVFHEHTAHYVRETQVDPLTGIITELDKLDELTLDPDDPSPPSWLALNSGITLQSVACGDFAFAGANMALGDASYPGYAPYNPDYGFAGFIGSSCDFVLTARSVSNTEASFTAEDNSDYYDYGGNKGSLTLSIVLSEPYTGAELKQQVVDLLAEWDLANDAIYPWRRDRYTTVNPLVSYLEKPNQASPEAGVTAWGAAPWVDPDRFHLTTGELLTGEILGKPFTLGYPEALGDGFYVNDDYVDADLGETLEISHFGVDPLISVARYNAAGVLQFTGVADTDYTYDLGHGMITILTSDLGCTEPTDYVRVRYRFDEVLGGVFDFRHVTTRNWDNAGVCTPDKYYYGAFSGGTSALDPTDSAQPRNATQWMTQQHGWFFPHGAYMWMTAATGQLWAQKYAEIKLPWKSQNWFGPCGADRDLLISHECLGESDCVESDRVFRFPLAFPIEGDLGVTFADMGGGTIRGTLSSPALYLRDAATNVVHGTGMAGDKVEFTNTFTVIAAMVEDNNSGSGYEVTAVAGDGTWFEFSGTLPAATYTRVRSLNAPAYWWYETDGKGEYMAATHVITYRGAGSSTTTPIESTCLPFNRCHPAVMCFSPNYDSEDPDSIDDFDNGDTYNFGSFTPDEANGVRWQGTFRQVRNELWWYPPLAPCLTTEEGWAYGCLDQCAMTEAGTGVVPFCPGPDVCTPELGSSGYHYYAYHKLVEARSGVPAPWMADAAPTMPTTANGGIGGGADPDPTLALVAQEGPGRGDCIYDVPAETSLDYAPWPLWLALQTCICNEGRFAEDYKLSLGTWLCGSEPAVAPTGPSMATLPATDSADVTTDAETETTDD